MDRITRRNCVVAVVATLLSPAARLAAQPADAAAAKSEYQRKLEAYRAARQQFDEEAGAYWTSVADKRRQRNAKRRNNEPIVLEDYVLTHPPVYAGPPRPPDPSGAPEPSRRAYVPVVADFLQSAKEHFAFVPQRPRSEIEFKRAYAKVAAAAGITSDQAVRVYGFEVGGNGTYDTQAG